MRNELKHIEEIENYLLGNFSADEKKAFEQRMENDPALEQDVSLQKKITERIALAAFITDVKTFQPNLSATSSITLGGSWFLNTIVVIIVSGAAALGYYFYQQDEKSSVTVAQTTEESEDTPSVTLTQVTEESITNPVFSSVDENIQTPPAHSGNNAAPRQHRSMVIVDTSGEVSSEKKKIEQLQMAFTEVSMDADRDTEFYTRDSKSRVMIPGGIMVHEDGTPVKGKITITYREFRNPAEMAFSNIPMKVKENNQEMVFNSAGMIEIRAYQNDEPLKIGKDQSFTIDYNVTEKLDSCYFWSLNDESLEWNKICSLQYTPNGVVYGVDEITNPEINPEDVKKKEPPSEGFVYGKIKSILSDTLIPEYQVKLVSLELSDKTYPVQYTDSGYVIPNVKPGRYLAVISSPGYQSYTVEGVKIPSGKLSRLEVMLKPEKIRSHAFYKIFYPKDNERRKYNRMLKNATATSELDTFCLLDPSLENLKVNYVENDLTDKTEIVFEKTTPKVFVDYTKATQNYSNTVAGLTCAGFGVYNCDQVKRMSNPARVRPSFASSDPELSEQASKVTVIIDRALNAAFTFYTSEFTYDKNSQNILLIYSGNKIYYVSDTDFNSAFLKPNGQTSFQVMDVSDQLANIEDLKNLLAQ